MATTIRMLAFYLQNKKAATVNKATYEIMPARTPMIGQDGLLAHSKGAVQVKFTVTEVTPISGSSLGDINAKVLAQEDIEVGIIVAGKYHRVTCAATSGQFEGDAATGAATGSVTLEGGVPNVV